MTLRRVLALLVVASALTACSSEEPRAGPTPIPIEAECREAFTAAQERLRAQPPLGDVAPEDPVSPVPTQVGGSLMDLAPTLEGCPSPEQWFEAYRDHPSALTQGLPADAALRTLCERVASDAVQQGPLCGEVLVPLGDGTPGGG